MVYRSVKMALLLWGLGVLVASCAPIRSTSAVSSANDGLFKARLAGVDKLQEGEKYITPAQFQYLLAQIYVDKAKEFEGFSKFHAAEQYATQAAELARDSVNNKKEEERRKYRRQQIKAGKVFKKGEQ